MCPDNRTKANRDQDSNAIYNVYLESGKKGKHQKVELNHLEGRGKRVLQLEMKFFVVVVLAMKIGVRTGRPDPTISKMRKMYDGRGSKGNRQVVEDV